MDVDLLRGRGFNETDTEDGPRVVVINETMAQKYWPGENPVGKRFRAGEFDGPEVEIIGVCQDYKVRTVGEEPRPYIHFSVTQSYSAHNNVLIRTVGDPAAAIANLRTEMLAMDPNLIFLEAETLSALMGITQIPLKMGAVLIGLFGVLGTALAAVGLYGVIAYSVSRRTREIGLRLAVGADGRDVVKMVLRQGMSTVAIGVALGLAGAAVASQVLETLLIGISPLDPVSFSTTSVFLLSVALWANYVPARRATRVDPVVALRHE
jgi:predicted permease